MYRIVRLIALIVLISGVGYVTQLIAPWWIVACTSAVLCFALNAYVLEAFIAGLLGTGSTWLMLAWQVHTTTQGQLSGKVAQLLSIEDPLLLIVGTGIIGGVASGLGGMSGSSFRNLWRKKKKSRRFYA